MTALFLVITIGALWINLAGLALAFRVAHKDYAVARISSVLLTCLVFFFIEHFVGLGPRPPLMLICLPLAGWLIWKYREVLRQNWTTEAYFALGFFYALIWRCTYPDIDLGPERLPDLMFLQSYAAGETLPATDRWLPPFDLSFYYGFQHYSAALMGRLLRITPEMMYHLGYCTLAGLVTCAAGAAARRFSAWRPAPLFAIAFMLIGGNGVIVGLHALVKSPPAFWMSSRFLGLGIAPESWTWLGRALSSVLPMGKPGIELPMDMFSYTLGDGQFHAPQIGFVLAAFTALLLAAQERGATGRQRLINHGLLAAAVPLGLIGNSWLAPLQALLLGAWLLYCTLRGEKGHWMAAIAGGGAATLLAYPHLLEFTRGHASPAPIRLVQAGEHSPVGDWLWMFWPVVILLILGLIGRDRRRSNLFLAVLWCALLVFAEFVFADDIYTGTWNRFNSTLKWWPWIYTGVVLTVGMVNLGSVSRICRWGSVATIGLTCVYGLDLARLYRDSPKPSVMKLEGSNWIAAAPAISSLIAALRTRPDGIALESGNPRSVTEVTAITAFGHKTSFLGWPVHEEFIWRGPTPEVTRRQIELDLFYKDKLPDPAGWLLQNNISYVLWLQRDQDPCFHTLRKKLHPRYTWYGVFGDNKDWFIGFFEINPQANPSEEPR